jgi:hypothetical protein
MGQREVQMALNMTERRSEDNQSLKEPHLQTFRGEHIPGNRNTASIHWEITFRINK